MEWKISRDNTGHFLVCQMCHYCAQHIQWATEMALPSQDRKFVCVFLFFGFGFGFFCCFLFFICLFSWRFKSDIVIAAAKLFSWWESPPHWGLLYRHSLFYSQNVFPLHVCCGARLLLAFVWLLSLLTVRRE